MYWTTTNHHKLPQTMTWTTANHDMNHHKSPQITINHDMNHHNSSQTMTWTTMNHDINHHKPWYESLLITTNHDMNHHDDPKRALHKAIWLPCYEISSPTLQTIIRSILTKLTYWDRTHSQELPNQLVLQNWTQECRSQNCTLNSKCNKCCKWTCCSDLPIWQALYQPGMVLLPRWTTEAWTSPPQQPPTTIHKTAAKVYKDTRSWHNAARG